MIHFTFAEYRQLIENVGLSAGDATCDEYDGTCDITSGFRCVRFNDVTSGADATQLPVQCLCTLASNDCTPAAVQVATLSPISVVVDDVTDKYQDVDGHSEWQLSRRHTDRLIGRLHIIVNFDKLGGRDCKVCCFAER